jgi:hypothetical protein
MHILAQLAPSGGDWRPLSADRSLACEFGIGRTADAL